MSSRLIVGCGYLGERVAQRWREAGHAVSIVTRSSQRADALRQQGYLPIVADITRPETLAGLAVFDSVLSAVGFDRNAGGSIHDAYAGGLRNLLAALPPATGRLIYISSTGVYGPANGDWVDEATPPNPQREGGRASLAAEEVLAAHPLGSQGVVLRLAGLYGPGRVPFIRELRADEPIPARATGWLNLIHVEDAAAVIVAAAETSLADRSVYCVSDGVPVERGEYYSEVARQISAPPPRFVDPDPNSPRAARAEANRRISNARMMADLQVRLTYPDYRAGLADAVETQIQ